MTHAELLRSHANLAIKEGGMYYSGEYLSGIAAAAESLEAENAKLRKLAQESIRLMQADGPDCGLCKHYDECWTGEAMDYSPSGCVICTESRELGIEVDE